ncbi:MAG: hypothetical protein ABJB86_20965 [Bacteroidota bacterium]
MKNFLLVLLLAIIFVSCKKDNTSFVIADPNSLDNATPVSAGKITFSDDRYSESAAKMYLRKDGVYVLALEQMNYETFYYDTNVYLSSGSQLTTTSIKVASAKKLHGTIYYPLSSGINIPAFKYLIIQADIDTAPVASATMK